jgi:hypothetical protein
MKYGVVKMSKKVIVTEFLIVILLLANIISCSKRIIIKKEKRAKYEIVVTKKYIKFIFPIDHKYDNITIYKDSTCDNILEFAWFCDIELEESTYTFGIYLFKFPELNNKLKNSPLPFSSFLQIAQTSVWKRTCSGGDIYVDPTIKSYYEDNVLTVKSENRELLNKILKYKPEKGAIKIIYDRELIKKELVDINYK